MNCPTCGRPIPQATREEIFERNAKLLSAKEWTESGGSLKEWVCVRAGQCPVDRGEQKKVIAEAGNNQPHSGDQPNGG